MATDIILVRQRLTVWNPQDLLRTKAAARYVADHRPPSTIHLSPTPLLPPHAAQRSVWLVKGPKAWAAIPRQRLPHYGSVKVIGATACASEHRFCSDSSQSRCPLWPVLVPEERDQRMRGLRASERPASCPLCAEASQVRGGCWEQDGDHWREDAGKMPAVRDRRALTYCEDDPKSSRTG